MPVARYNTGNTYNTPGLVYGPAATPPTGVRKKMKQNLASLQLDSTKLTPLDAALDALETALEDILLDLSPDDIRGLAKMGDKSETFCRETANVLALNPGILTANFNLAELQTDFADYDALRLRFQRITQITERMKDTGIAIGSDIMVASLEGYALAKVAGFGEGLDVLRREMGALFARKKKTTTGTGGTPPTP